MRLLAETVDLIELISELLLRSSHPRTVRLAQRLLLMESIAVCKSVCMLTVWDSRMTSKEVQMANNSARVEEGQS